jgi:hypothetical protein
VIPVLDKWIQEGETIWEDLIHALIKELRHYRRYHHALEVFNPINFFEIFFL